MKIKGFDKDLKCRGYQFEVGKEYKIENNGKPLELYTDTVFRYYNSMKKLHFYYPCWDKNNRFCEIEVLGEEVTDGEVSGSNHIRIVREIFGGELRVLKGLINGNTGIFNTGDNNAGDCNTGSYNTGHYNTGSYNTGHYNTGSCNTGDNNTGSCNTGSCNTGDFNSCGYSSGFFCTEEPKLIIFDKPTDMTYLDFIGSDWYDALHSVGFPLNDTGDFKMACAEWWEEMSEENREIIKTIPNFSAKKFKDITGIDVE